MGYQVFVDTSGSTKNFGAYYQKVKDEVGAIPKNAAIEFYEWAEECGALTLDALNLVIKNQTRYRISNGGTLLSTICDKLKMYPDNNIVIITDGDITPKEFENTMTKLKILTLGKGSEGLPKVRFVVRYKDGNTVDDSILLALGSSGMSVEYVINDEEKKWVCAASREELLAFVDGIDIDRYISDGDYKRDVDAKLRVSTVGCDDVDLVLELRVKIAKLQKSTIDPVNRYCDLKEIVAKLSNIADQDSPTDYCLADVRKEFLAAVQCPEPTDDEKRQATAIQQLYTILDNCKDTSKLYFETTSAKTQLPAPIIVEDDAPLTDSKYVECLITYQMGVPYLVFNPPAAESVSKSYLKQVVQNPLLITTLFDMKRTIGTFFVNNPNEFANSLDPRTGTVFKRKGLHMVLPLGTSPEHIKYTNQVINRALFNDYSVADADLMFLAIWYHLKYESQLVDAKQVVPCFEAQLRARFEEKCPLSLSSSIYENSKMCAEKWVCIWYLVHELPFVCGDSAPVHSATQRFLSRIDIFIAFLRDVYSIKVDRDVVNYLHKFSQIKQLIRSHNVADCGEFWRRIRALKTDAWYVDPSCSVVSMGNDLKVSLNVDKVDFNSRSVKVSTVQENRKATMITIPLDRERTVAFPQSFVSMFPKALVPPPNVWDEAAIRRRDRLAELALHIPTRKSKFETFLYFDRKYMNDQLIEAKIAEIGFDPRTFTPFWTAAVSSVDVDKKLPPVNYDTVEETHINTGTMRPESFVGGKPWTQCAEKVLGSTRFISFYRRWNDFLATFGQFPSLEDFGLFVYKKETEKTDYVYFKNGLLESRHVDKACFTLYVDFVEFAKRVLHKYNTIVREHKLSADYCVAVHKISRNINWRQKLEQNTLDVLDKRIAEFKTKGIPKLHEIAKMKDLGLLQAIAKYCSECPASDILKQTMNECFDRMETLLKIDQTDQNV